MDEAHYKDLAGRLYGLLIILDGRLGAGQARMLHHFIEVGKYGLALKEIAGALAQQQTVITGQERGDMLALARQMQTDDLVPRALNSAARRPADAPRRVPPGSRHARRSPSWPVLTAPPDATAALVPGRRAHGG